MINLIEQKKAELVAQHEKFSQEHDSRQGQIQKLNQEVENLRVTLLRISGAVQAYDDLLLQAKQEGVPSPEAFTGEATQDLG